MNENTKKVILHSINGYNKKYDALLQNLIDEKILLFCTVGKDCELWHDVMDELIVGDGTTDSDFDIITTWHKGESLDEVIQFAGKFEIEEIQSGKIKIIEI